MHMRLCSFLALSVVVLDIVRVNIHIEKKYNTTSIDSVYRLSP